MGAEAGANYLYDVYSDTYEKVDGDFDCFPNVGRRSKGFAGRFWQETSMPDKYYASRNQDTVGVFDMKTFEFTALETYDIMIYSYTNMWVDEDNNVVYVAVNGDLLELPLKVE